MSEPMSTENVNTRLRGALNALRFGPSDVIGKAVVVTETYKKTGLAGLIAFLGTAALLYFAKPGFVYQKDEAGQPILGRLNHLAIWLIALGVAAVVSLLAYLLSGSMRK